jgi:AcrR family transcriptional regulator
MTKLEATSTTRDRILRATIELIAEVGLDRVRTRAVAQRAGVNPALVHYHFGSMSVLLLAAAEVALYEELGPSLEVLQEGDGIDVSLYSILDRIQRFGSETTGSTVFAETIAKASRDPELRRWVHGAALRFRSVIRQRLEVACDAGEIDEAADLDAVALALAAALDGLLFHRLADPSLNVTVAAAPLRRLIGRTEAVDG